MSRRLRDDLSSYEWFARTHVHEIDVEVAGCPERAMCLRNAPSNDECFRVGGWRGGEVSERSYIYFLGLLRCFYVLHISKVESRPRSVPKLNTIRSTPSICLSTCRPVRCNRHHQLEAFARLTRARILIQHLYHQWPNPSSARTVECRKKENNMNESCLTRHKKTTPLYAPRSTLTERGTRGVLDEALPTTIRRK